MIKNTFYLSVLFLLFASKSFSQTTISQARSQSLGTKATVKGIALNGSELGIIRYIQDNTGGIAAYGSSLSSVKVGDSVQVTGTLKDYNALLELDPVENVNIINSGNPLPTPASGTVNDLFTEAYESELVDLENITFTTSGNFNANTNYKIKQNGVEKEVRINTGSNLVGRPIPGGAVTITGIMSQFKTTYQLLLRTSDDILQPGPSFTSSLMQKDITTTGFTLYFSTKEAGKTFVKYGKTAALELGTTGDNNMVTNHSVNISNLEPATFYYAKAYAINANGDSSSSATQLFSTASLSSGKIEVYFNSPIEKTVADGNEAVYLNKTIDDSLVAYISKAKNTLDIAVYSFDNANLSANISDALNAAYNRGVKIRFITDAENKNNGLNNLNSNIPVLRSPTPSITFKLMHNKFVIRDVADNDPNVPSVWTGSTNWTDNQIHGDPNHVVIIQDQALAKAYLLEFEEMWGSKTMTPNQAVSKFGPMKTDNIPHHFMVNGKLVELYFSPSDKTNGKIIDALKTADKEMYFSTMLITRTDIAYTIRDKANAGVFVAGILGDTIDASSRAAYHIMEPVLGNKLRVYEKAGIFHHKYAIVDAQVYNSDPQVITGSHNWSSSAENNNDENTLIIHDSTVANMFYQEWIKRYMESGGTDTFKYIKPVSIGADTKIPAAFSLNGYIWNNNQLNLKIESKTFGKSQLVLRDINGKLIGMTSATLQNGATIVNLQTAPLAHGIYMLTIVHNGKARSWKLLKS